MEGRTVTTPPKIRFSLKYKFICGIALLVGLIIALTSFNTSRREELLLSQSMDQNGLLLVGTLALACQDPMIREAYDELIPYTERVILGGEDIREISIFDLDGKYIAHRVRGDTATRLGETLAQAARDRYDAVERPTRLAMADADLVEYVAPIKVGSSRFGTIVLQFTFNRLSEAQSTSRRRILLISLVAMLAGVLLSVMLAQFITSGLDQLMKGTQVVSTGDLAYRLSIPSEDEIGMLATRFNDMIGTLEQSRNALDRKIFEIETLFKASQAMNFQNDTDKLVRQILEMAAKALKAERASMMLRVDQTDELVTKIVWGVDGSAPADHHPHQERGRSRRHGSGEANLDHRQRGVSRHPLQEL